MRKTEKLIKAFKVLMINLIIGSLLQNPFIDSAMAASNSGFEAKDILSLANGALGLYGTYLGQKQQLMQAQITAAANQKLMSQLSPSCRKADGTACYAGQAKYFPECSLPSSMSNMPANVCNNATPDTTQISSMITYESIAQGWMNYYDQMSNEASNSANSIGLRCLEDKQKALDSQLTEMINNLQRLQDRANQDKQTFRDNNKKLLSDMDTANEELFGGSKNLKSKTQDFSKYFSQSCQGVIGKEALKNGTSIGLNGVLQGLTSTNKAASDYNLNKNAIEDDVRRETKKITDAITSGGIDDWLNNSGTSSDIKSSKFPAMESVIKKQAAELQTARTRIAKDLAKVGYTAPNLDKNFSVDMNTFIAGAEDYFKKKYINDCVTGADKGVAIPIDQVLKSIKQSGNSGFVTGSAESAYRSALETILNSSDMLSNKMDQIKALEAKYPGMTVTYNDSSAKHVTESPYNLLMKTISVCETRYGQSDTFSSKGAAGVSYQENVNRAKADLVELKNLNDNFSSKLSSAVNDQLFNCNGEAYKSGSDCNEQTLQTTSDNFCTAHASQCASDIKNCYAEANNQVQIRKTKMENLAKTYNANVAAMVAKSNALYESQKNAVTNITKLIQQKFPGTNFTIPADMFVTMPAMSKNTYGVDMVGDGNISDLLDGEGSMPKKIEKLKQMFASQKSTVDSAMKEYVDLQKDAMQRERSRWADLNSQCKEKVDSSSKALAQMNNEGQKNQAKQDADVAKFCKKYNSISQNPIGACNQARDLADSASQISARLSGQAETVTEQFANACDGYNNEKDANSNSAYQTCMDNLGKGDSDSKCQRLITSSDKKAGKAKRGKALSITKLCGTDMNKPDSDFFSNVGELLSKKDGEKVSSFSSLTEAVAKADKLDDDGGFISNIADLVQGQTGDSTCAKLKAATTVDGDSDATLSSQIEALKAAKDPSAQNLDAIKKLTQQKEANAQKAAAKKLLTDALNDLSQVQNPAPLTGTEKLAADVKRIGEQAVGQCDMQSNATVAKNQMDMFGVPTGFDQSVLGKSK